jgi:hypothetical protein
MVHLRFAIALTMFVTLVMAILEAHSPQGKTTLPKTAVADISGKWAVVVTFPGPPGMPDGGFRATVTLKQHALDPLKPGPLDGYFTLQNGNGGAFKGIVNNKKVTFTAVFKSAERPGVTVFNDFIGTLEDANTIKGHMISVSTGPDTYMRGEGPFVAARR